MRHHPSLTLGQNNYIHTVDNYALYKQPSMLHMHDKTDLHSHEPTHTVMNQVNQANMA